MSRHKPDYRVIAYKSDPTIADTLPDALRELLQLHYIDGNKWCDVADIMHYSIENIFLLRRQALYKLEVVINGSKKE